jgi:hypothetical protein
MKRQVTLMLSSVVLASHINAVPAVYLLVAILKKRLHLDASLYTILQILSLTLFEKMPISQALSQLPPPPQSTDPLNNQCLLGF